MDRRRRYAGSLLACSALTSLLVLAGMVVLAELTLDWVTSRGGCSLLSSGPGADGVALGPPGTGAVVGATEYGGPGDPSSGVLGASGANLLSDPDSYAELGGTTFQTATALGGLPYMTPLQITWSGRSAIAYKRDFGLGGGPIDGLPRALAL